MFSKTIFKQTFKQNWKLWAIFTALTATLGGIVIAVFDPKMIKGMMDIFADMPGIGDRISEMMSSFTLLGMLGESFYSMQGVILPLVFVIMTGNSLIASQVDRGSMAYTLSTPIKRTKVVSTQAIYMITSIFCMFVVVTIVGLGVVQVRYNALWGSDYTPDVKAVSSILNLSNDEVSNDLTLILKNSDAVKAGAEARRIDEDEYIDYLNMKIAENAPAQTPTQNDAASEQAKLMQEKIMAGMTAAAKELDMDVADLATNMKKIKSNPKALEAAVSASELPEEMLIGIINQQIASDEISYDNGIDFSVIDYVNLNLGIFLLMFAIAGISFLFSCVFNLTKNSLALGAGIPIACFIFQIMSQASSSLEGFRYLSLNTLYNPSAITGGGTFIPQFIALAVFGSVLYLIGIKVFKEKDLPL